MKNRKILQIGILSIITFAIVGVPMFGILGDELTSRYVEPAACSESGVGGNHEYSTGTTTGPATRLILSGASSNLQGGWRQTITVNGKSKTIEYCYSGCDHTLEENGMTPPYDLENGTVFDKSGTFTLADNFYDIAVKLKTGEPLSKIEQETWETVKELGEYDSPDAYLKDLETNGEVVTSDVEAFARINDGSGNVSHIGASDLEKNPELVEQIRNNSKFKFLFDEILTHDYNPDGSDKGYCTNGDCDPDPDPCPPGKCDPDIPDIPEYTVNTFDCPKPEIDPDKPPKPECPGNYTSGELTCGSTFVSVVNICSVSDCGIMSLTRTTTTVSFPKLNQDVYAAGQTFSYNGTPTVSTTTHTEPSYDTSIRDYEIRRYSEYIGKIEAQMACAEKSLEKAKKQVDDINSKAATDCSNATTECTNSVTQCHANCPSGCAGKQDYGNCMNTCNNGCSKECGANYVCAGIFIARDVALEKAKAEVKRIENEIVQIGLDKASAEKERLAYFTCSGTISSAVHPGGSLYAGLSAISNEINKSANSVDEKIKEYKKQIEINKNGTANPSEFDGINKINKELEKYTQEKKTQVEKNYKDCLKNEEDKAIDDEIRACCANETNGVGCIYPSNQEAESQICVDLEKNYIDLLNQCQKDDEEMSLSCKTQLKVLNNAAHSCADVYNKKVENYNKCSNSNKEIKYDLNSAENTCAKNALDVTDRKILSLINKKSYLENENAKLTDLIKSLEEKKNGIGTYDFQTEVAKYPLQHTQNKTEKSQLVKENAYMHISGDPGYDQDKDSIKGIEKNSGKLLTQNDIINNKNYIEVTDNYAIPITTKNGSMGYISEIISGGNFEELKKGIGQLEGNIDDLKDTYKGLGDNFEGLGGSFNGLNLICDFKVVNDAIVSCKGKDCELNKIVVDCPEGDCPPGDDDGQKNLVYRPISLVDPFPDTKNTGSKYRKMGSNWNEYLAQEVIENNRNVKDYEVYSLMPLYTITLTPSTIKDIRAYNKKVSFNNFDMQCINGYDCSSNFLWDTFRQIISEGESCATKGSWEACRSGDGE